MSEFNRQYDGKVLIYYLSAEDSGEYECFLPSGESRRVSLKVIAPKEYEDEAASHSSEPKTPVQNVPSIDEEPRHPAQEPSELTDEEPIVNHDKQVDAGANVELACQYTSSSPDNLKWKKINGVITLFIFVSLSCWPL